MNKRTIGDGPISKLNPSQQNLFDASKLIGQMITKSFGPFGLEKLTVNNYGDAFIIRDGKSILEKANLDHPIAKLMLDLAETITKHVGDGSMSAILLTSFLLDQARINIEKGIHPNTIIDGYEKSLEFSLDILDSIRFPIETRSQWHNLVYSSLSSKFGKNESEKLSRLTVEAISSIDYNFRDYTSPDYVNIVSNGGDSILNSRLIDGIVFDAEPISESSRQSLSSAKIAILYSPISISNEGMKKEITINDPTLLGQFKKSEKEILFDCIQRVVDVGANVLFSHKTIDDLLISRLNDLGIFTVKRVPLKYLEMIEKSTGALMVNNPKELTKNKLGHCSSITSMIMYDKNWIFLNNGSKHKSNTILIRTQTQRYSDLYEDLLNRILLLMQTSIKHPYYVFGCGWFEFILAAKLRSFSHNIDNLHQLIIKSYSDSIELIPFSLALNAGFNNIDLIVNTRNLQPSEKKFIYLDLKNRKLSKARNPKIIESAYMKKQILISATETAISILRISDVYRTVSNQKPK